MAYSEQIELYDATSDAIDFLLTVMVPLLAVTLFEARRQTERSLFTFLDDFIIYASFLTPITYFYFDSIKTGATPTLNFAVVCALGFALILLIFDFFFFMKEDSFSKHKKWWSMIYSFLLSVNVFELGAIFKTNTVVNELDPYVVTAICDWNPGRCNLATTLLIIAGISSLLLLFLPIFNTIKYCCITSFYIKLFSTIFHAVTLSMVTLVVGWTLSNSEYVTKIILAMGTLSITRIINRFKDFDTSKVINSQGQEEEPKRILLSHFLFDFEGLRSNDNIRSNELEKIV